MFVTHKPEDGSEPQTWEFLPDRIRASEQAIVERQYGGKSWPEFVAGVLQGRAEARRVLLWHLIRRQHPHLKYVDTPDFLACELLVEQSPSELAASYDAWAKAGGRDGEDGPMLEAMFTAQIDEARAKYGEPEGKALSSSEPGATSGP